jgi:hypothetical protein
MANEDCALCRQLQNFTYVRFIKRPAVRHRANNSTLGSAGTPRATHLCGSKMGLLSQSVSVAQMTCVRCMQTRTAERSDSSMDVV